MTGKPFDRYLHEQIFEPLGMSDTDLLRSDRVKTRLATGYQRGSGGAKPVTDAEVITARGGGIYSTPRDMGRYLAALLGGGANERGSVLKPESLATMYARPITSRIPDYRASDWRSPGSPGDRRAWRPRSDHYCNSRSTAKQAMGERAYR